MVLIIPSFSYGQKMDKPVVDGFTHEVTTSTTADIIAFASSGYLIGCFIRKSGVYTLYLRSDLVPGGLGSYHIAKGNSVFLKLANDSLITLPINKEAQANVEWHVDHYYRLPYWSAYIECTVPIEDVRKISLSDFTGVRIVADDDNIDFSIQPAESKKLKKMAMLILSSNN
ncbi:MAG: hypothetical protein ACXVJB_09755 [Mucilaginibacter sp.]